MNVDLFQSMKYAMKVTKLHPVLDKYLKEGVLVEEFILDSIPKLLNVMRDSNVTLRWLMLHTCALSPSKLMSQTVLWLVFYAHVQNVIVTEKNI